MIFGEAYWVNIMLIIRQIRWSWNLLISILLFLAVVMIINELMASESLDYDYRITPVTFPVLTQNHVVAPKLLPHSATKRPKKLWLKENRTIAMQMLKKFNRRNPKLTKLPGTNVYVYSAFFDQRNGNKGYRNVRIVAVSSAETSLECKFKAQSGTLRTIVSWYMNAENHNRPMKTFILGCEVPKTVEILRNFQLVSATFKNSNLTISIDKTVQDPAPGLQKYSYSLCMPVLFGFKYPASYLIEFFESVKLLGIQHVFLYTNYDSQQSDVLHTLLYYSRNESFLSVFPLDVPFQERTLFYHGQLLAITDCLYHNMGLSKIVFFHDFDERVVPYPPSTNYKEMFGSIWDDNSKLAGVGFASYIFQDLLNIGSETIELSELKISKQLDITERRFTKCAVRPEKVFEQGVHHVSRVVQDYYQVDRFNATKGVLHHFKKIPKLDYLKQNTRLKDLIGEKLERRYQELKDKLL